VKVFVSALVLAVLLAGGAAYVLNLNQKTAYQAFATTGVRISEPGYNLVGKSWNGLNEGDNLVVPNG
jgi:hypothetical protein